MRSPEPTARRNLSGELRTAVQNRQNPLPEKQTGLALGCWSSSRGPCESPTGVHWRWEGGISDDRSARAGGAAAQTVDILRKIMIAATLIATLPIPGPEWDDPSVSSHSARMAHSMTSMVWRLAASWMEDHSRKYRIPSDRVRQGPRGTSTGSRPSVAGNWRSHTKGTSIARPWTVL